jgi:Lrp/AsnC family transcriptional regulator, leucine-responsive regulatory protein
MKLDEIDLKILAILQLNGRITNVQLSQEIGLSPAPTLERVRKLEQHGYIKDYHALLNPERLGLNVMIFIEVSLNLHKDSSIDNFMEEIAKIPEVVECYQITGGADFLMKIYAENINNYQRIIVDKLAKLADVGKLQSKVVLNAVKDTTALPIPAHLADKARTPIAG